MGIHRFSEHASNGLGREPVE